MLDGSLETLERSVGRMDLKHSDQTMAILKECSEELMRDSSGERTKKSTD